MARSAKQKPPYPASEQLANLMANASGFGPWETWRGFLAACHLLLDDLPYIVGQVSRGETVQNTPEQLERWNESVGKRFSDQIITSFAQGFAILLNAAYSDDGVPTYEDVLGSAYMQVGAGCKWSAQYFTPMTVARCMGMMIAGNIEQQIRERIMEAAARDIGLKAMMLTALADPSGEWFHERVFPYAARVTDPLTVCEPCVGSGVLLLAFAAACPRWAIVHGFVQFFGMDIDGICVEMTKLNCRIYGLRGGSVSVENASEAQLASVPEPHRELYAGVIEAKRDGDEEKEQHYRRGVELARRGQLQLWGDEQ